MIKKTPIDGFFLGGGGELSNTWEDGGSDFSVILIKI